MCRPLPLSFSSGFGEKSAYRPFCLAVALTTVMKFICIVGGAHRVAVAEVDLVLPGAFLVVRAFGLNTHVEQSQADLAPHVFALVLGRNVM